jgi:Putative beta barrel porin-7 (BBP7)
MNSRNLVGIVICAILLLAACSAVAFSQNDPAACRLVTDNVEDSTASFSETAVDQSPCSGSCDLGGCQSYCCPRWTASADFIFLNRTGGGSQTLVERVPGYPPQDRVPGSQSFGTLFTAPGVAALSGNDFQQGFSAGPRLGLIRHGDCGYDLELLYFQIDGWSSNRTIVPDDPAECLVMRAPGNWLFTTTPGGWNGWIQTNQDGTQAMAWDYATRLYNAELNVRWNPYSRVTMLAGFRWVNLRENLEGSLSPPTVSTEPPFWSTTSRNNLYGFQIGADGTLFERGRFSIGGLVKAGIFDNNAEQNTAVSVIHKSVYSASATTNHTAFVGETGLQCNYQVSKRLLLKAGYELIWLNGVALAPEQVEETYATTRWVDSSVQALGINSNSGVFYHGATAGLEYSF